MISKEMEKAINEQINREFYSAYLYLSMATFLAEKNVTGMAQFMKVQAQEETTHAMKMYDYVEEQGGRVLLDAIDKPDTEFDSILAVFKQSFEHEQFVTKNINGLMDLAIKQSDHATKVFLDWFVSEQVEEEATFDAIIKKLELIGENGHGILMIDEQLNQRTAPPAIDGGE